MSERTHSALGAGRDWANLDDVVWRGVRNPPPARAQINVYCFPLALSDFDHGGFPWRNRPSSLILKEVKNYEGVNVDIKLEGLGGNRRRISGGLYIEAPPSES